MQEQYRQWLKGGLIIYGLVFFLFTVIYVATLHVKSGQLLDVHDYLLGRDFVNFWAMGVASDLPQPERFYDINTYNGWLRELIGMRYFTQQWSYPPTMMLAAAPFKYLPYYVALGVFVLLSLAAMLRVLAMQGKDWRLPACVLLLSPASWIWLVCGQNSMLTAAVQIAVFLLMRQRPWLAGGLVGLLCVKPHLAVLYPVYFALTRQWKCFAAAAITVVVMLALTAALWGMPLLMAYVTEGIGAQHAYVVAEPPLMIASMMPTIYMDGRLAGAPYSMAMAAQLVVAIAVLAMLAKHWWRSTPHPAQDALLLATGTLLVTPYLMVYDTLFFTWAVIAAAGWMEGKAAHRLLGVCVGLPILHFVLGVMHVPGSALVPGLLLLMVLARQKHRDTAI